jgi:hypothetical protein
MYQSLMPVVLRSDVSDKSKTSGKVRLEKSAQRVKAIGGNSGSWVDFEGSYVYNNKFLQGDTNPLACQGTSVFCVVRLVRNTKLGGFVDTHSV